MPLKLALLRETSIAPAMGPAFRPVRPEPAPEPAPEDPVCTAVLGHAAPPNSPMGPPRGAGVG